jgi:hypothetical protein
MKYKGFSKELRLTSSMRRPKLSRDDVAANFLIP